MLLTSTSFGIAPASDAPVGRAQTGFWLTNVALDALLATRLSWSTGLGGTPEIRDVLVEASPGAAWLGWVDSGARRTQDFDLVQIEDNLDPDGEGVDSNPCGVFNNKSNSTLVVDSGGNSLIRFGWPPPVDE